MPLKRSRRGRGLRLCLVALLLLASRERLPPTASAGAPDPSEVGEWSSLILWPISSTHAVVLPDGFVFFWRGLLNSLSYRWDPATDTLSAAAPLPYDMFCVGQNFTGDGKVLVSGGHIEAQEGLDNASYYDWISDSWTQLPDMNAARWYPSNTTLANGDVLVTSGYIVTGKLNKLHQVWQVASGSWRSLTTAKRVIPAYPQMFATPNGKTFMAGPTAQTLYLDTAGTGSWSGVGYSNFGDRTDGVAVMYDDGKILIAGGGLPGTPPTNTAEVIDLQAPTPVWSFVPSMVEPRRWPNATLLPDGKVLVTGGHRSAPNNDPAQAVYLAEMWDPQTETWSSMAPAGVYRSEHSIALLLPDGRVLSSGGDQTPRPPSPYNRQIYSPPYLFKGPRPTITSAPATVGYGQTFFVATPDSTSIANVNWLALGATTHSTNMGQRINRLSFSQAPGGLNVTAPANGNLCPKGYYMLFILNGDGVPSVAATIRIS